MQVGELLVNMSLNTGQYEKGLQQAEKQGRSVAQILGADFVKTGKSAEDLGNKAAKTGQQMNTFGGGMNAVGMQMMTAGASAGSLGTAITTGFGAAIKHVADFQSTMSTVKAVTGSTGDEFKSLSDLAMKLGADTKFSSAEAAQGMAELAKSGVSTADIMGGGLAGALSLAAAGDIDVASAAETAANAMNMFGLKGKDVMMVADLLASAANKSSVEVRDLQLSLNMVGNVAATSGQSINLTTAALALMGKEGLKNSDAGTSMKQMLLSLQAPTDKARGLMDQLGMSFYDSSGKMKSLDQIAGQLQRGMAGLTQEQRDNYMATLFGSDAVRAANIMYKNGAQGVNEMAEAISKKGEADRIAKEKMDNLNGAIEQAKGAFSSMLTSAIMPLLPMLQQFTQSLSGIVDKFAAFAAEHPKLMQYLVLFGALTGVMFVLEGAVLLLTAAIAIMGTTFAIATFGIPILIAAIVALVVLIVSNWDSIKAKTVEVWTTIWNWLSQTFQNIVAAVTQFFAPIVQFFSQIWSQIMQNAQMIWETIKSFFFSFWEVLKTMFYTAVLTIYLVLTGQWDKIGALFSASGEKIKQITGELWDKVKSIWGETWESISTSVSTTLTKIGQWFVQKFNQWKQDTLDTMTNMKKTYTEGFQNAKQAIVDGLEAAGEYLASLPDRFMEWGKNMVDGLIDGIKQKIADVKQAVSDLMSAAADFIGFHSPAKKGEGRNIVKWGQNMVGGFMDGIQNALPELQALMNSTIKLPDITTPQIDAAGSAAGLVRNSAFKDISSTQIQQTNTFHVTIPVKDLQEIQDVNDFFKRIPQAARAMGVV